MCKANILCLKSHTKMTLSMRLLKILKSIRKIWIKQIFSNKKSFPVDYHTWTHQCRPTRKLISGVQTLDVAYRTSHV